MKISFKWLCELVEGLDKISPEDVAKKLTMSGLEVEEYLDQEKKWQGLVVGEVIKREPHPDADKLSLCQVSDGKQTFQVVCGAPNVTQGKKYPFATLGTVMPQGLKIAPVKLRGVESLGMLCSAKELELSEESNGLYELPQDFKTGEPLSQALQHNDVILTLNVTPNRGDALSHWGVAKDVAALLGLKINFSQIMPKSAVAQNAQITDVAPLEIQVQDSEGCPRYSASQMQGVKVGPSPLWLQSRLQALGQRSINNVVDATNYVMLLTGHPVHAFDARQIQGAKIVVHSLAAAQTYKTLDDAERLLQPKDLVIADAKGPVALAGIMGGQTSSVQDDTQNLILEVAFFEPNQIRRTSRRLGLQTESSYRFARFVNPDTVLQAHQILQHVLTSVAGGSVSQIQDFYPQPLQPVSISLFESEWQRILGVAISKEAVLKTLQGLDFKVEDAGQGFVVTVPVGRSDITRAIDLIEEIGRIYGLDQIPAEMPRLLLRTPTQSPIYTVDRELKTLFVDQGFTETIHLSFGDEKLFSQVSQNPVDDAVVLKNPISEDLKIMRPTLLAHLLSCFKKNSLNSEAGLKFFEMRKVYHKAKQGYVESYKLCALYAGNPYGRNRFGLQQDLDFYHGKGILESLVSQIDVPLQAQIHSEYPFHPGQSLAYVHQDSAKLVVGAVHPEVLQKFKIKEKVFAIEIDMDWLTTHFKTKVSRFQPVSQLPYVYRDLAILVDKQLTYDHIMNVIQKHKPAELSQVHLFDLFQGESLPEGKVSMAFSLVYEAKSSMDAKGEWVTVALNDDTVNSKHFALVEALQADLGVQLR